MTLGHFLCLPQSPPLPFVLQLVDSSAPLGIWVYNSWLTLSLAWVSDWARGLDSVLGWGGVCVWNAFFFPHKSEGGLATPHLAKWAEELLGFCFCAQNTAFMNSGFSVSEEDNGEGNAPSCPWRGKGKFSHIYQCSKQAHLGGQPLGRWQEVMCTVHFWEHLLWMKSCVKGWKGQLPTRI